MKAAVCFFIALLLLPLLLAAQNQQSASDSIPPENMQRYSDLAVRWMREYLRIDTTNPPGNEAKAATFFKRIFDAEGIENQIFEFAPSRANIWARVPCTEQTSQCDPPLILLNHMDVVSSDPSHWKVPPFSGAVVNDAIYGRGAQDMKNEGIAQAVVLVMLKREKVRLTRDIIFLATGDEEVDDLGAKWMIDHKRDLLGNAEYLMTEGGETSLLDGRVTYVGVDVAEKAPFWLHMVAHGQPGHGSRPITDSAPDRLIAALGRISNFRPELKLIPVVEDFLRDMAPLQTASRAQQFLGIRFILQDKNGREQIRADESLAYMFQDTIAVTMLGGSPQTNVIPNEAWANIDVRLLPGTDPHEFLENIRRVVNDSHVTIEPMRPFAKANSSPTDTRLWQAIRNASAKHFNNAPVIPRLTSGYTESQLFRQLGIVCYGFSPYVTTAAEAGTEHGDDERVRVEEVRRAPQVLYDVVMQVAGAVTTF